MIMNDPNCLFCKMVAGQIQTNKVYEDETVFAFNDIDPQAPVHVLVIPKEHIASLAEIDESKDNLMGHLLVVATKIAKDLNISDSGYRVVINTGKDAGQAVGHIHLHLLGGRDLKWPPG